MTEGKGQGLCLGQLCDGGQESGSVFRAAV